MVCKVRVGSVEQEYFRSNWSFDRTSVRSWSWSWQFRFEPVLNLVELVQVGSVQVWVQFNPRVVGSGSGSGKMGSEPNRTELYQPYLQLQLSPLTGNQVLQVPYPWGCLVYKVSGSLTTSIRKKSKFVWPSLAENPFWRTVVRIICTAQDMYYSWN